MFQDTEFAVGVSPDHMSVRLAFDGDVDDWSPRRALGKALSLIDLCDTDEPTVRAQITDFGEIVIFQTHELRKVAAMIARAADHVLAHGE